MKYTDILKQEWEVKEIPLLEFSAYEAICPVGKEEEVFDCYEVNKDILNHITTTHNFTLGVSDEAMKEYKDIFECIDFLSAAMIIRLDKLDIPADEILTAKAITKTCFNTLKQKLTTK